MNVQSRLKKLEASDLYKLPCLCGKTFIQLFHEEPGLDGLTPCPDCQKQYDYWMWLASDAATSENLTDAD